MNEPDYNEFDHWLDGQLKDVRLPGGLRERLQRVAAPSDDELDAELHDVTIPVGLMTRLYSIPVRSWGWGRSVRRPLLRLAVAAGLLLTIGTAWFAAMLAGAVESWARTASGHIQPESVIVAESVIEELSPMAQPRERLSPFVRSPLAGSAIAAVETYLPTDDTRRPVPPVNSLSSPPVKSWFAIEQFRRALLLDPVTQLVWMPNSPTLRPVRPSALPMGVRGPSSVDLPLTRPEERTFLSRAGVFPPVLTGDRAGTSLGLSIGTGSYDLWREYLRRGQLPSADQIRTEEFLAALARLSAAAPVAPAPKSADDKPTIPAFALNVSGGPSPFGGTEYRLVHIGLRMRDLPPVPHRATQLTLLVDTSAAMANAGRLDLVRRALAELPKHFGATDRLNLIRYADSADVLLEGVSTADASAWRAAVGSLQPSTSEPAGGSALAGIGAALSIARTGNLSSQVQRRLVIVTHGGESWDESSWRVLKPALDVAAAEGVKIDVVPISPVEPLDPNWQRLSQAGGGTLHGAVHQSQLSGRLVEALTGRSQIILPDGRLTVSFPAQNVVSYRLLGNEPTPAIDVQESRIDWHLYGGQASSVVFEIRPSGGSANAGGPDVELATVALRWRDRRTGEMVSASRRLMRSQLKATFAESSPPWQTAALVATVAEVLRGSPFADQIVLSDVIGRLKQLPPAVADRPEFKDFLANAELAEQVRQRGTPLPVNRRPPPKP